MHHDLTSKFDFGSALTTFFREVLHSNHGKSLEYFPHLALIDRENLVPFFPKRLKADFRRTILLVDWYNQGQQVPMTLARLKLKASHHHFLARNAVFLINRIYSDLASRPSILDMDY